MSTPSLAGPRLHESFDKTSHSLVIGGPGTCMNAKRRGFMLSVDDWLGIHDWVLSWCLLIVFILLDTARRILHRLGMARCNKCLQHRHSISHILYTQFALCLALLWFGVRWFSHIFQSFLISEFFMKTDVLSRAELDNGQCEYQFWWNKKASDS